MTEIVSLKRKLDVEPESGVTNLELYLNGASTLDAYFVNTQPPFLQNWKEVFANKDGESKLLMAELFDDAECDYLYKLFEQLTLEVEPTFYMTMRPDRPCKMHRDVGFFSDSSAGYKYANQTSAASPLRPELQRLIDMVNALCGSKFNGVLVNRYKSSGSICAHSDNEKELSPDVGVVALSVGAVRTMRFREVLTKQQKAQMKERKQLQPRTDVVMPNGSLMCMFGKKFQKLYTHEINPESAKAKKNEKQYRYSLTFRCHNN